MNRNARDVRPAVPSSPTLVSPRPQAALIEHRVLLGAVLAALVVAAFHAGNAPFGVAVAVSLALLGRAAYLAHGLRAPPAARPPRPTGGR